MIIYILSFFVFILLLLYFIKNKENKENKKNKDYQLIFLIYSIIFILVIIYIRLLFSDIFINFLKEYTSIGYNLELLKNYFYKSPKSKLLNKSIEKTNNMIGGSNINFNNRNLKIRDFIVNNDLPLSDSDSSIDFIF